MKYFFSAYVVVFLLLGITAHGQVEQWDTYVTKLDNKPGSILVDMGLSAAAPDKKYPNLVITGPQAQKCDKQGLPVKDEIETLEEILTATGNFITGVTPKLLAGTFMYNCQRLNYYYVKDTTGIRNALARMYTRSYPNYNYAIKIKSDPEWSVYRTFLYPDEPTLNWMENRKVIAKMQQAGDSLKMPRDINFNLYFYSDTARRAFGAEVNAKGFTSKRMTQTTKPPILFGIVISRKSSAVPDTVNILTATLRESAKKHNGYFKEWNATPNP